jgi:hypothetical protein
MQTSVDAWKAKEAARKSAASALQAANPHLVPSGAKFDSLQAAAKNIRLELKRAFPGIVFSVKSRRFSGGDAIDIRWIDGPVTAQVDAIANRYKAGTFDGMTDSYQYEHSAWRDAFGDAQYISASRDSSARAIESAIRTVFHRYAGNLKDVARPTAEQYQSGKIWGIRVPGMNQDLLSLINEVLYSRCWSLTRNPEVR